MWATALLVAGDPSYDGLWCGHGDSPSALCNLTTDIDPDDQYLAVMDLASTETFEHIFEIRRQRCHEHGIDDTGPDGFTEAA